MKIDNERGDPAFSSCWGLLPNISAFGLHVQASSHVLSVTPHLFQLPGCGRGRVKYDLDHVDYAEPSGCGNSTRLLGECLLVLTESMRPHFC